MHHNLLPYEALAHAFSQPMMELESLDPECGLVLLPRGTTPTMLQGVPGGTRVLVMIPGITLDVNVKGEPREIEQQFREAINSMIPGKLGEVLEGPGSEGTNRPEVFIGYVLHEEGKRIWPEDPQETGSYADAKIAYAKFEKEGRKVTVDGVVEEIASPSD